MATTSLPVTWPEMVPTERLQGLVRSVRLIQEEIERELRGPAMPVDIGLLVHQLGLACDQAERGEAP
jgi:hypothetical protein